MTDIICDLDGVLWRGDTVIPGVPQALMRLRSAGARLAYVTNNASKTPESTAVKIAKVTGDRADPQEVVTSTMAALTMLDPDDAPVLVVGEEGITVLLERAGVSMTTDPGNARSVMVGVTRGFDYHQLGVAADALRNGARFIATNTDPTFPIQGGFLPGAGSIVAAIATASGVAPEVAGKPFPPIRSVVRSRFSGKAWVIGDRLDSDIAMAVAEPDWTSVLVLTGSSGADEETSAADHVVADLTAAVDLILSAG